MRKHTHDGDRLTFGCPACIRRVDGDQFWAEFIEECDNPDYEDVEFGLALPITLVFADHQDDDRVRQFAEFIPNGLLTAILSECGPGTALDDLLQVAAHRLMAASAAEESP